MQQFSLENELAYKRWREEKLHASPQQIDQLFVDLADSHALTLLEKKALLETCKLFNIVIYKTSQHEVHDKDIVADLAQQLGLEQFDANLCADEDKISLIQVVQEGRDRNYIPYTDKALNWHTDGYYNQDKQRIRSFLMHCVRPAKAGGENTYIDPEIVYILLRDESIENIRALMHPQAMTIPANQIGKQEIRKEKTGPVFLIDDMTQTLYMRYTARARNVIWKADKQTQHALDVLSEILNDERYQFRYRLKAGEGVICNNVLHNRSEFMDDDASSRLLYRARFHVRVPKVEQLRLV